MKVKVEITEILKRVIEVDASSVDDAVTSTTMKYADGFITLDRWDRTGFSIKQYTGEDEE